MDGDLKAKYELLGFTADGVGMVLQLGNTKITAVEHPLKGVALIFSSIGGRSASYFESSAPAHASIEQIAALIYFNVAMNIASDAETCKRRFRGLGIFQ